MPNSNLQVSLPETSSFTHFGNNSATPWAQKGSKMPQNGQQASNPCYQHKNKTSNQTYVLLPSNPCQASEMCTTHNWMSFNRPTHAISLRCGHQTAEYPTSIQPILSLWDTDNRQQKVIQPSIYQAHSMGWVLVGYMPGLPSGI